MERKEDESFYALYFCNPTSKGSTADAQSLGNKSGNSQQIYMNILDTNLSGEKETDLRCFLQKRIQLKDIILDTGTGAKAASLDVGTRESVMCVYHLFSKLNGAAGQGYCLAFIAPDDGCLDLFLNEVELFMRAQKLQNCEKFLSPQTKTSLLSWHAQNTLFIGRVLRELGERTSILLHLALSGGTLDVEQVSNAQLQNDLRLFMNCCGLQELRRAVKSQKAGLPKIIVAKQDEDSGRIELSSEDYSADAVQWCRRLLQENPDDSVTLRRIIEGYKIRTIQDMNLVRRIVRKAENDHYALYQAYKLLKDCGYTKTLLGLSMSEHSSSRASSVGLDGGGSGGSMISSRNSSSSSDSNNSILGQDLMGDDVISLLLEHLPNDTGPFEGPV